ncbi:MAG: type II secretion system protein GspM [Kofleriaceae bacterium]
MANITERARDFWDRISPRERRLVVIGAIALPITVAIWLALSIHDGLTEMEARNEKTRKALRVLDDLKARGTTKTDDEITGLLKNQPEPISLDTYLSNAAQKAGFTLKGTTPRNPVPRNGFVTTSVACDARGLTIDQLRKFLEEIESKKLVAVTNLTLRRDRNVKEKLDATLEVSTYSQPPAAKTEAAGSGSAKGS